MVGRGVPAGEREVAVIMLLAAFYCDALSLISRWSSDSTLTPLPPRTVALFLRGLGIP